MERSGRSSSGSLLKAALVLHALVASVAGQLVPAVFIFGDSVVDAGNNNALPTLVRANFAPYGRDFAGKAPTGRFCNGKLATDFTVENLGFSSYPPAYLSPQASGKNLLTGVNFASGASGYWNPTAGLYNAISLSQQVDYFKQYKTKLSNITTSKKAKDIISGAIYLVSAGSSDYLQNYYINPLLLTTYTPSQFGDLLIQSFTGFVQDLYGQGARRIGATTLPPMGCLPAAITLFGGGNSGCVDRLNKDAATFNNKMTAAAQGLSKKLPGLKLVVLDIYNPLYEIIRNPAQKGFFEAGRACCGTGTIETSLLCNSASPGTCTNAKGYVFWDSFHPTEAANQALADDLLTQGIGLIG